MPDQRARRRDDRAGDDGRQSLHKSPGRVTGLTVAIAGHDTTGVAVCNQVRSFDLEARLRAGSARYVETLDPATTNEIVSWVLSVIDPESG